MSWTTPRAELSEQDKIFEQLKGLPMRDHTVVVGVLSLTAAFKDHDKIEASHFKDLAFAVGNTIKHASTLDTLQFLSAQLKKAPEATTVAGVVLLLSMMARSAQEMAEKATTETMKLVALLPSEGER